MMLFQRVPLAWLNLIRDKRRFVVYVAGVSFAVGLMFIELGFYNALIDSTSALIDHINADLVILSEAKVAVAINEPFTRRRLYQAMQVPGVAAVYPLYIDSRYFVWLNRQNRSIRPIRVVAFDPNAPVMQFPEVSAQAAALRQPWTVMIDAQSKPVYGDYHRSAETELSRRKVRVVGTFRLGTDFTTEGTAIMSDDNYERFLSRSSAGDSPLSDVEVGVVQLEPGADAAAVRQALSAKLPADVKVMTKDAFRKQEQDLWKNSSPIGYVFWLGTLIGFVVGVVICYQILSTDISDHLAEYATLKAIGYPDRYLTGVVLQEALLLSLFGFALGLGVAKLLYLWLQYKTGLPMHLTWDRAGLILVLTVVMCMISGLIAIRQVQTADPAEVF